MKVKVIEDKCIGCGNCISLTEGQVFDFNDDGMACVINPNIEPEFEDTVKDAIDQCPTSAIEEE